MRTLILLIATIAVALVPRQGEAADPPQALDAKGYVYGAPGIMYVPLGDDDYEDLVDPGYRWGVGVGGVFSFARHAGGTIGFAFDHSPLNLDEDVDDLCGVFGDCDFRAHQFRLAPELRIGGGAGRFFGYGMVAPGLALITARYEATVLGEDFEEDDTDAGFGLGIGGGALFSIYRGLTVGAEFGASLAFFAEDDDEDIDIGDPDEGYGGHSLDFKVFVGYWF